MARQPAVLDKDRYKPERKPLKFKAGEVVFVKKGFRYSHRWNDVNEPLIIKAVAGYMDGCGDHPWYYCIFLDGSGGHVAENHMKGAQ
jgi:hypothetical protein